MPDLELRIRNYKDHATTAIATDTSTCDINLSQFVSQEDISFDGGFYEMKDVTIPRCEDVTYTTFQSYKPHGYIDSATPSQVGQCCFTEQTGASCSSIFNPFVEISSNIPVNPEVETLYKYCGLSGELGAPPQQVVTKTISSTDISGVSGNITDFLILIVSVFIALLIYILFVLGPFLFWTKYAPNKDNHTKCYDMSLLDRYYGYNPNELPYAWEDLKDCKDKRPELPITLDKCMTKNDFENFQKTNKISGLTIWDTIVRHFGGFPYYYINKDKENEYTTKHISMFVCTIVVMSLFYTFIIGQTFDHKSGKITKTDAGTTVLRSIFVPFIIPAYTFIVAISFKFKHEKTPNAIGISFALFIITIIVMIMNATQFAHHPNTVRIFSAIFCAIVFYAYAHMSGFYMLNPEIEYDFILAFRKIIYYIRKSLTNCIKYSLMGGRGSVNWAFSRLNNLPIPDWFYIIFGHTVIPIIIAIVTVIRIICSLRGIFGLFGKFISEDSPVQGGGSVRGGSFKKMDKIRGDISREAYYVADNAKKTASAMGTSIRDGKKQNIVQYAEHKIWL